MHRVDSANSVAVRPTPAAAGTPGFYDDGPPGTIADHDAWNAIQEELVDIVVTLAGLPLDKADVNQVRKILEARIQANRSSATDTGSLTTTHLRALLAATTSQAVSARSAIVASESCTLDNGDTKGCMGSDGIEDTAGSEQFAGGSKRIRFSGEKQGVVGCGSDAGTGPGGAGIDSVLEGNANGGVGSQQFRTKGNNTAVLGSLDVDAGGAASDECIVAASVDVTAGNVPNQSAVIGCADAVPGGTRTILAASKDCEIAGGHVDGGIIASQWVLSAAGDDQRLVGGDDPGGSPAKATANKTWALDSINGDIILEGTVQAGPADYAEVFENTTPGELPVGSLIARIGRKVRLAQPGDRLLGVVSVAPAVIGNAAPFEWQGRWQRDEFGRPIMVMVPWAKTKKQDDAGKSYNGPADRVPKGIKVDKFNKARRVLREDWDKDRTYSPRAERPNEWTKVGLLGQLCVRVDATVLEGDDIMPGPDGLGTQGESDLRGARIECMEITTAYDADAGYGVALCMVR